MWYSLLLYLSRLFVESPVGGRVPSSDIPLAKGALVWLALGELS
jgi:hypothetical protein